MALLELCPGGWGGPFTLPGRLKLAVCKGGGGGHGVGGNLGGEDREKRSGLGASRQGDPLQGCPANDACGKPRN